MLIELSGLMVHSLSLLFFFLRRPFLKGDMSHPPPPHRDFGHYTYMDDEAEMESRNIYFIIILFLGGMHNSVSLSAI